MRVLQSPRSIKGVHAMRLAGLLLLGLLCVGPLSASAQGFGDDTYRTSQQCTGAVGNDCTGREQPAGLTCEVVTDGSRRCSGFLASAVDQTRLDVTVLVPAGDGPHPLIVSLHGWGGSKDSQGYIADPFSQNGYAVLRYSARGFGESWGQVNLSDVNMELGDLRSMIGQVLDRTDLQLRPDAVGIIGVSYGGGQTWLSLLHPTFQSPGGRQVVIRAVVPIVPWTDLLYSLAPNGRPLLSLSPAGSPKLSYINALYVTGQRQTLTRPYPNYPDYLIAWHAWINTVEPNESDPVYRQIRDGLAGYRSIWWQSQFWTQAAANRVPVFQVQGLTDDLFPLPEARRMLLGLAAAAPGYPIASYFGDIGHPRASNKVAERDYMLGLVRNWFDYYLRETGAAPAHVIRAAITRPRDQAFNPADVITVASYDQLATRTVRKNFFGTAVLANPVTDPLPGFCWDPLFMEAWLETVSCPLPPEAPLVERSLGVFTVPVAELTGAGSLLIAGQPVIHLSASTGAPRVQLNVRLIDVAPDGTKRLITRGTFVLEDIGTTDVTIPTYGNLWQAPRDHLLRLEITNVDSPYIRPSLVPSVTVVRRVQLQLPVRE
jgi:pimeloyl-ACP methyl ester carboxylesterase